MMERLSSHIFVLDPKDKPVGAKYIGFIGNKLMVEPCDNTLDVLTAKRSFVRLDSFVVGSRHRSDTIGNTTFDIQDSTAKLNDLKKQLIYHKVYCALRL